MQIQSVKYELQNIISGKSIDRSEATIQAVADYLRTSQRASPMAEGKHQNKAEETKSLIAYAHKMSLLYNDVDEKSYISEGAEQKVFIRDGRHVIKLNDAIYYASWEDYFHNLLLHNYFFADTSYQFLGFYHKENQFFAVVEQSFVKADALTDLQQVKLFLNNNGFENTKNHDYYHPYLGVILEDLHDENVLTQKELLYFIDTVFYIQPEVFWQ